MTKFFPYAVQFLTEAQVSVSRIQKLLLLDEFRQDEDSALDDGTGTATAPDGTTDGTTDDATDDATDGAIVKLDNVTAYWSDEVAVEVENSPDSKSNSSSSSTTLSNPLCCRIRSKSQWRFQ